MRQAEANAAPAARAAAKVLVRKAAAPATPGTSHTGPRAPGAPKPAVPPLGGHLATSQCPGCVPGCKRPVPLRWLSPAHSLHLPQPGATPQSDAARAAPMPTASPAPSDALKHRHLLPLAEAGQKTPFSTQKAQTRAEKGGSGSTHRCPHQAISRHPVGSEPEEVAEAEVTVVMAIAAVWDGAQCPRPQDAAPEQPQRVSGGGHSQGWGAKAAPWFCGTTTPLGLVPANAGRIFLDPPKIVWECGSPCKPQGWGGRGGWGSLPCGKRSPSGDP